MIKKPPFNFKSFIFKLIFLCAPYWFYINKAIKINASVLKQSFSNFSGTPGLILFLDIILFLDSE